MKPRFEEATYLKKARELALRIDKLELKKEEGKDKEKKLISCLKKKGGAASLQECADACGVSTSECKKMIAGMSNVQISKYGDVVLTDGLSEEELDKMGCGGKMSKADMATKDKYCMKNFGKKYSECSKKQKAQCDKAHGKMEKAEPGYKAEKITDVNPHFVAESGGQTKSGYFTTNGKTIETEDAKKTKKGKESANMEALSSAQNPHEGGGVEREIAAGGKELKKFAGTICSLCGGTNTSGCNMPEMKGTNIKACPLFKPL